MLLHGRLFEVDPALVGQRVTLRYAPAQPQALVKVIHNGQLIERAQHLDLYANCFVKRLRPWGNTQTDNPHQPTPSRLSLRALAFA